VAGDDREQERIELVYRRPDPALTNGPPFNAVPFRRSAARAARLAVSSVGDAGFLRWQLWGPFSYSVNGVAQTKNITREVFASPGTVCH
jgi:hypothetical protein